jgi:hypothetical protein
VGFYFSFCFPQLMVYYNVFWVLQHGADKIRSCYNKKVSWKEEVAGVGNRTMQGENFQVIIRK